MKKVYVKILKVFIEEIENNSEDEAKRLWEMLGEIIEPEKITYTFNGTSSSDILEVKDRK